MPLMTSSSDETPDPIKRELRQEAAFGCCICGNPIYGYHHIVPRSTEQHFRVEDMMVLCPNHHRVANVGGISEVEQRKYKSKPYNRERGLAEGMLRVLQSALVLQLGTNVVVGDGMVFEIDTFPLLQMHLSNEGIVQISASLYDRDDNLLVLIDRNEWIAGDPLPWDIEFGIRWLTLRERRRRISLTVDARRFPMSVLGRFCYKGHQFRVNKVGINIDGTVVKGSGISYLGLVAQRLKIDTVNQSMQIIPDERFGRAVVVSHPVFLQRVIESVKAWQKLKYPNLILRK